MMWTKKTARVGDIRVKRRFLLLPLTLDGMTRWLEVAAIKEEYVQTYYWDSPGIVAKSTMWEPKHWWTIPPMNAQEVKRLLEQMRAGEQQNGGESPKHREAVETLLEMMNEEPDVMTNVAASRHNADLRTKAAVVTCSANES